MKPILMFDRSGSHVEYVEQVAKLVADARNSIVID